LLTSGGKTFLFKDNKVFKITNKIEESNMGDVSEAVEHQKTQKDIEFDSKIFEVIKKELGEFEVLL